MEVSTDDVHDIKAFPGLVKEANEKRRIACWLREFQELGYEGWAGEKGYGRRWAVETAFSTFKRLFGEHSLARTMDNIARELVAKVSLYNMLVNL
jgi:hypothetical protein